MLLAVLPPQPISLPVLGRWFPQEAGSLIEAEAPRRATSSLTCVRRSQQMQQMYVPVEAMPVYLKTQDK